MHNKRYAFELLQIFFELLCSIFAMQNSKVLTRNHAASDGCIRQFHHTLQAPTEALSTAKGARAGKELVIKSSVGGRGTIFL